MPSMEFMKKARLDALWDKVFGPDHKPEKILRSGIKHRNIVGKFPTERYAAGGIIRTRLPIMLDGLIHLDTDPRVVGLSPYPLKIHYLSEEDGEVVGRHHVPDIGVRFDDGSVGFVDYMPFHSQDPAWFDQRTRELRLHFSEEYGAGYAVHDERCIYPQPLFRNLSLMWRHKPLPIDHESIGVIAKEILAANLPMTMGQLTRAVSMNAFVSRYEDEPDSAFRVLDDTSPVFTACMQLAIAGKVKLDLSRLFSPSTIVSR